MSLERECVLRHLQTDKNPYRNCTRHNCCCQERLSERKAPCCYTGALRYSRLSLLRRFTNVHKLVLPLSFPPTIVQPFVCFLIFVAVGFSFLVAFFFFFFPVESFSMYLLSLSLILFVWPANCNELSDWSDICYVIRGFPSLMLQSVLV